MSRPGSLARPTLLVLALAAALTAAGADWPQFRGPARDGISGESGLLKTWPAGGPKVLWRRNMGEGFSAISAASGKLYTMFAAGPDEYVAAIDGAGGQELWRVRVDEKWVDEMGNGPRSTPTVHAGVVYALSGRSKLHALAAADGKALWQRDLRQAYGATIPQWGVSTSPLVEGDLLLVEVGGRSGALLVAFDKKTGTEVWKSQSGKPGYSAPLAVTVGGLRQVLFFSGQGLVAVAPKDGAVLWTFPWKTSYDVNAAMPIFVPPDRVFISSGYDVGGAMLRIKVAEGKASVAEVWRNREMKNQFSTSVLHRGILYGFDDKTLKAVDAATGETRWSSRGLGHGSLIYADGHLVALGDNGLLVLVEATAEAYREKARAQIFNSKTWTMPVLVDGKLFLRDEKEILALQLAG